MVQNPPVLPMKGEFRAWLNGLLKDEYRTDRFFDAAWKEALECDANGRNYELEARYTLHGRPYLYRVT